MKKIILIYLLLITVEAAMGQPAITGPASVTVCQGAEAFFVVNASGIAPFTYQWQEDSGSGFADITDGTNYAGTTTTSLTVGNVQLSMDGYTYRCIVTDNDFLSTVSVNGTLTVLLPPTQPGAFTVSTTSVCQGQIGVAYTIPNDPAVTYNWSYSGSGVTINGTTNSVTINFSTAATSGVLGVTATNGCTTSAATTLSVTVNPLPIKPGTFTTSSATVCRGQTGVVYTVPNDPTTTYNWSYSGTGATISGTTNSVTVGFNTSATSGSLSVTAANGCGTSAATSIAITVNPLPAEPAAFTTSTSTVCQGQSGVIYTIPIDATVTNNWSYSGTGASVNIGTNGVTINFNNSATSGTLSVTSTNGCGTSAARTIAITVKPLPSQPGSFTVSSTPVCAGQSNIIYTVPVDTGVIYNWSYSGSNTSIHGTGNSITLNYANNASSGNLSVLETNSCGAGATRGFPITVNPLPTGVSFTQTSPYSSTDAGIKFAHTPLGGIFTGIGITSADSTFHPNLVGPGKYAIKYTYTNSKGCSSSFTDTVSVISPSGDIIGFSSNGIVCYSSGIFTIKGTPGINPHSGINNDWFEIDGVKNGQGLTPIADSTASFDPKTAGSGGHVIKYKYQIGVSVFEISKSITVESVLVPNFIGLQLKYCDGEPQDTLTGINPSGGSGHFFYNGPAAGFVYPVNSNNNQAAINAHAIVQAIPGFTGSTYKVSYYYTTTFGCKSDTVNKNVAIYALPVVNFNIRASFNVSEPPVKLSGNPTGGAFSGRGVVPSDTTFSPALANVQNHIPITYSYTDPHGCSNSVTKYTDVIMANAYIKGLTSNNIFCYDGKADTLVGVSMNGIPGGTLSGSGIRKFGKSDTALFFPNLAGSGVHTLTYSYTNSSGTLFSVSAIITVDSIGPVAIDGLLSEYCANNNTSIALKILTVPTGQPGTIVFTGSGVSKNATSQYFFTPVNDKLSSGNIVLTYSRNFSGCKSTSQKTVKIDPVPVVNFALNNLCVINSLDSISFINKTTSVDPVISWSWNFGDNQVPANKNVSTLFQPKHAYISQGPKSIILTASTNKGCSSTRDSVIYLGNSSKASFTWRNECYYNDSSTMFISTKYPVNQTKYVWNFGDNAVKTDSVNTASHHYATQKNYNVRLIVLNNFGCRDTLVQTVYLRKVFVINDSSYYSENFAHGKNGWIAATANSSDISSWTFGKSAKFNTAVGDSLWFTIPKYKVEQSWVTSPCFDFSEAKKPMIKFDKWSSFDKNRDGALLQYKTSASSNWKTLGTLTDGINWYESFAILGQPGNQPIGWSGLDNSFVSARHQISALAGEKEARFRVIYASDGSNRSDNGFAFDNIGVSERQHVVLLEHFTNTSEPQSIRADAILDSITMQEPLDMVNIKYHTGLFGADLFNQSIHSVSDVRSIYYGVPSVPYATMDGGYSATAKYNYMSHSPTSQDIELRSLIDPPFKIVLKTANSGNGINISTLVTSLALFSNREISVHIAVIRIDTIISNKKMRNILLALLPDPAGVTYNQNWSPGDSKSLTASYAVNNISDTSKLLIVAFIQDETSREVLQVAANRQLVISTGINAVALTDNNKVGFKIFPNPAKNIVNVVPDNLTSTSCIIEVYNSLGVLVQIHKQEYNSGYYSIDVSNYPNGLYVLKVINFNNQVFTQKLIINH